MSENIALLGGQTDRNGVEKIPFSGTDRRAETGPIGAPGIKAKRPGTGRTERQKQDQKKNNEKSRYRVIRRTDMGAIGAPGAEVNSRYRVDRRTDTGLIKLNEKPAAGRKDARAIGAPGAEVKLRYRPDGWTRPSGDLRINKTRSRTGGG